MYVEQFVYLNKFSGDQPFRGSPAARAPMQTESIPSARVRARSKAVGVVLPHSQITLDCFAVYFECCASVSWRLERPVLEKVKVMTESNSAPVPLPWLLRLVIFQI